MRAIIFLLLVTISSWAANKHITEFAMTLCSPKNCAQLKAPSAQQSELDDVYVFAQAELTLFEKRRPAVNRGQKKQVFQASSGYFDPSLNRIILRGLQNSKYNDLIYNLKSGEILFF